jgi:hypothetical protein
MIIILFITDVYRTKSKLKKINKQFPSLVASDHLDNYVERIFKFQDFKYDPYIVFVKLNDGKVLKIYTYPCMQNIKFGINDILREGDRLIKRSGIDSLYVYEKRNDSQFIFLLRSP